MKLVVNLIPLKAGGGQRVGLNFILSMVENDFFGHKVHFLVNNGSVLESELKKHGVMNYSVVPTGLLKRLSFELFWGRRLLRRIETDAIYTVFGYSLFGKEFKQISGVAYSNLFFPEINFWVEYKGLARLKKSLVDVYRSFVLKKATALIFENPAMEKRAHKLWSYPSQRTTYIPPSIYKTKVKSFRALNISEEASWNVLMLCGWQRNKNIHLVPKIAAEAKARQLNVHFTLTVAIDGSPDSEMFKEEMDNLGVSSMISLIGQVPPEEVSELYLKANSVMLLSKLESFSNNIIEAWTYGVPLFITDHDWAREICKKAAFYVDRDSPNDIVSGLQQVIQNEELICSYIALANEIVTSYPSIEDKTKLELEFINQIVCDS
ncbi:glycosyltransferase family 4 protein [Roseivirga sp. E12]|uniref:glycosyltransferase family 4 protein n=1 Tax=Roseivirga sp. E12 TaxID=2819237 RepID=UPI001ABCAC80|nr:glycosyltransferase [Roseivirga sp. E12]MBO3700882.1 glycosyltransferase [Roseivirga sp. E12]